MKNKLLFLAMGLALSTQMILAQVPSYVPTNGLVGYWPFNGNANDISGYLNNGIVNGAALTMDRFGNANSAYSFNGTNNYIKVLSSASLQPTNSISYSCWVYLATTTGTTFFTKNYSVGNNSYAFERGPNNTFGVSLKEIGGLTDNNSVNLNSWNFLMCTYDGAELKYYLNGILYQSLNSNLSLTYTPNNLFIGVSNDPSLGVQYFSGKLDDIGIWNRALTQDEITSLYYAENTCQSLVINTGVLSFNPPTYQNTVTIYPNPANDQITIDCGTLANVTDWKVKISNSLGQEVFTGAMNTQQHVVPLNSWGGQGIYFVKIYDASNNLMNTKKIILQ